MLSTASIITSAFRHHWSAHSSLRANFWFAICGMIINNMFFLYGMWLMIFDGKEKNTPLLPYYLTLVSIAYLGWGLVICLAFGLRNLGERISDGSLEPMLGTPRHPLLIAAISDANPAGVGDVLQGLISLALLFCMSSQDYAWRALLLVFAVSIGFLAVFIFAGSISFFLSRGNLVGDFVIESTLSLSIYPTGKCFTDYSRYILYLSPALLTGILPMQYVEQAETKNLLLSLGLSGLGFFLSVRFFRWGLRRYQGANLVSLNR